MGFEGWTHEDVHLCNKILTTLESQPAKRIKQNAVPTLIDLCGKTRRDRNTFKRVLKKMEAEELVVLSRVSGIIVSVAASPQ